MGRRPPPLPPLHLCPCMRGCGGGKLICFKCGQEGHFAHACKFETEEISKIGAFDRNYVTSEPDGVYLYIFPRF